jgi:hypothetical protein
MLMAAGLTSQAQDEENKDALLFFKDKFPAFNNVAFIGLNDSVNHVNTYITTSSSEDADIDGVIMGIDLDENKKFTANEIMYVGLCVRDPQNARHKGRLEAAYQKEEGYVGVTSLSLFRYNTPLGPKDEERYKTKHQLYCASKTVGGFLETIRPFVPSPATNTKGVLANQN